MATETEAKIKVSDLGVVAARLHVLGATDEGAVFERNWVLDRPDGEIMKAGALLRVRNTGGPGGVLTVKHRTAGGEFKTREEVETRVDSCELLLRQLETLGFRVGWIYEKRRATWLWRDCVVTLDECPEMGGFVEIEGEAEAIRRAAADIGLDPDSHIDDNYLGVWMKYLAARGEAPRDMVFPHTGKGKNA